LWCELFYFFRELVPRYAYEEISRQIGKLPSPGVHSAVAEPAADLSSAGRGDAAGASATSEVSKGLRSQWRLLHEECSDLDASRCDGAFDRDGHCCIVRAGTQGGSAVLFRSRYPDYQEWAGVRVENDPAES
jgi:hypothetical protein